MIDTSVLASAFRSVHGASRALVRAFDDYLFVWLLSNALLTEYEAVLKRPEQICVHRFSHSRIDTFLDDLVLRASRVKIEQRLRPQLRDPDDELVLETAVNGLADAIVTHNVRDIAPAASMFGVAVLTPAEVLRGRIKV